MNSEPTREFDPIAHEREIIKGLYHQYAEINRRFGKQIETIDRGGCHISDCHLTKDLLADGHSAFNKEIVGIERYEYTDSLAQYAHLNVPGTELVKKWVVITISPDNIYAPKFSLITQDRLQPQLNASGIVFYLTENGIGLERLEPTLSWRVNKQPDGSFTIHPDLAYMPNPKQVPNIGAMTPTPDTDFENNEQDPIHGQNVERLRYIVHGLIEGQYVPEKL